MGGNTNQNGKIVAKTVHWIPKDEDPKQMKRHKEKEQENTNKFTNDLRMLLEIAESIKGHENRL